MRHPIRSDLSALVTAGLLSALLANELTAQQASGANGGAMAHRFAVLGPRDTIAIDQYVRDGNVIVGQILRQGVEYRLELDKAGNVVLACVEERRLSGSQAGTVHRGFGQLGPHGVTLRTIDDGSERTITAEGRGRAALYVPMIVSTIEQVIRATPVRLGDSARVFMANFRYGDTVTGAVTRFAADSFAIRDSHNYVRAGVSKAGDLEGYPYPQDTAQRPRTRLVRLADAAFSDTTVARLKALTCGAPGKP